MSLLTRDYWQNRNRLGMPVPLFKPLESQSNQPATTENGTQRTDQTTTSATKQNQDSNSNASISPIGTMTNEQGADAAGRVLNSSAAEQANRSSQTQTENADNSVNRGTLADEQQAARDSASTGRKKYHRHPRS